VSVRLRAWETLCRLLFSADDIEVADRLRPEIADPALGTELVGLANMHLTTAPVWLALGRKGLRGELDGDTREYLAAFYALNAERNRHLERQFIECTGALNQAEVIPMPLKGIAYLLSGMYPDPAERFLGDIDLLVPSSKMRVAAAALTSIGFQPARSRFDYSRHHHLPPFVRTLDDVAVELHVAPVAPFAASGLPANVIWAGARSVHRGSYRWCVANATDSAMLMFMHAEIMDRDLARCVVNLRGFLDLGRMIRNAGAEIDWQRISARARQCGYTAALQRYLYAYTRLTGETLLSSSRASWRGPVQFAICKSALRWPTLQLWAQDFHGLAAHRLKRRYSLGNNRIVLNAYRIRALGGIFRNRIFGSSGDSAAAGVTRRIVPEDDGRGDEGF